jgi:ComF family protein
MTPTNRDWIRAQRLMNQVLRFLLPWACAGCRRPLASLQDEGFCGFCWLKLPRILGTVCRLCGIPLKDGGNLCFVCHQAPSKLLIRAATEYDGALPPALHRFKYAGRKTLSHSFSILLERAWERYRELQPADALVPVPLHPSSHRDRGYNQALILAHSFSSLVGIPVLTQALTRIRRTAPQFKLQKTERLTNLKNAFLTPTPALIKGTRLLLIDDVCTTGTTLRECAHALRRAGAVQVKALVLARDL